MALMLATEWLGMDTTWVQTTCAVIGLLGLLLIVWSLRHSRSANLMSAWLAIEDRLQRNEDVLAGRTLLAVLSASGKQTNTTPPISEWPKIFLSMENRFGTNSWYKELSMVTDDETGESKSANDEELLANLTFAAREAYREWDLVGHLVFHSQIPGLKEAVVAAWRDSIIACWEAGRVFFKERLDQPGPRTEMFQCFSALYIAAKWRKPARMRFYG